MKQKVSVCKKSAKVTADTDTKHRKKEKATIER